MKANRGLSIERMVKLGRVSRSGFYRFQDTEPSPDRDMDLRDAIQRIAVEMAQLRPSPDHRRTAAARMAGESETGLPADA
jgi:hypothetical protein